MLAVVCMIMYDSSTCIGIVQCTHNDKCSNQHTWYTNLKMSSEMVIWCDEYVVTYVKHNSRNTWHMCNHLKQGAKLAGLKMGWCLSTHLSLYTLWGCAVCKGNEALLICLSVPAKFGNILFSKTLTFAFAPIITCEKSMIAPAGMHVAKAQN